MIGVRKAIQQALGEAFLRDYARPVEWISLLMLAGWLQFMLFEPDVFAGPRYVAFSGISPGGWATILTVILAAQLFAMWPTRRSTLIRFLAMACAAGIWTVIAVFFWSGDVPTLAARSNTVMAAAAVMTAIYLGVMQRD